MIINDYVGRGGHVRIDQILRLTDLEISSKPTPKLVIYDLEIVSRLKD